VTPVAGDDAVVLGEPGNRRGSGDVHPRRAAATGGEADRDDSPVVVVAGRLGRPVVSLQPVEVPQDPVVAAGIDIEQITLHDTPSPRSDVGEGHPAAVEGVTIKSGRSDTNDPVCHQVPIGLARPERAVDEDGERRHRDDTKRPSG
jgi:hypothetical protein